eukprot:2922-Heterococcus_DN1.PRE.5
MSAGLAALTAAVEHGELASVQSNVKYWKQPYNPAALDGATTPLHLGLLHRHNDCLEVLVTYLLVQPVPEATIDARMKFVDCLLKSAIQGGRAVLRDAELATIDASMSEALLIIEPLVVLVLPHAERQFMKYNARLGEAIANNFVQTASCLVQTYRCQITDVYSGENAVIAAVDWDWNKVGRKEKGLMTKAMWEVCANHECAWGMSVKNKRIRKDTKKYIFLQNTCGLSSTMLDASAPGNTLHERCDTCGSMLRMTPVPCECTRNCPNPRCNDLLSITTCSACDGTVLAWAKV